MEKNKCDKCPLKEMLKKAIENARKTQEYYLEQAKKANETIAKYTKKIDKLEEGNKNECSCNTRFECS